MTAICATSIRCQPATFRQVCAIAERILHEQPAIDFSTWNEAIKQAICDQHFDYPEDRELIGRAMKAVEHQHPELVEAPQPPPRWAPRETGPPDAKQQLRRDRIDNGAWMSAREFTDRWQHGQGVIAEYRSAPPPPRTFLLLEELRANRKSRRTE
jgi:hypothetical protein